MFSVSVFVSVDFSDLFGIIEGCFDGRKGPPTIFTDYQNLSIFTTQKYSKLNLSG